MNVLTNPMIFPTEYDEKGKKTKGAENKQIAQEVGIKFAHRFFKMYLEQDITEQPFNFNWKTYGESVKKLAESSLFGTYQKQPKNIKELEQLAGEAAALEWLLLVESTHNLPIRVFTTEEKIEQISELATKHLLMFLEINFFHSLDKKSQKTWKKSYKQIYTKEKKIELALEKMNELVNEKCNEEEKSKVLNIVTENIKKYYEIDKIIMP